MWGLVGFFLLSTARAGRMKRPVRGDGTPQEIDEQVVELAEEAPQQGALRLRRKAVFTEALEAPSGLFLTQARLAIRGQGVDGLVRRFRVPGPPA